MRTPKTVSFVSFAAAVGDQPGQLGFRLESGEILEVPLSLAAQTGLTIALLPVVTPHVDEPLTDEASDA